MKLTISSLVLAGLFLTLHVSAVEKPDPRAIELWADKLFAQSLTEKRMSGAVLTVVQDGEIVVSKGYGYADLHKGTPVNPDTTRFRIGSTTKTFTATAIAQLMDKGEIHSLDDPANKYLKRVQLPGEAGARITLAHLLTHSAGFENLVFNIGTEDALELPLSEQVIGEFASSIINRPGQYSSYNNYGTALLGLIVEDVSGEAIADYFDRHIFRPLKMDSSILNMSPEPSEGLGVPYGFLPNGEPLAIPHRTVHPFFAPVGGINATGNDMGRYMLAQLDYGRSENAILSEQGFHRLHTQLRSNHALSSGFGMIFFTWLWNGERVVLHGGDWPGTHSGMVLFPDSQTGVFFSLMAEWPEVTIVESILGSARLEPVDGVVVDTPITNLGVIFNFMVKFFGTYEVPGSSPFQASDLSDYAGNYVGKSAPVSTMERLLNLTNSFMVVNVTVAEDGTGLMINEAGPYIEVAPGSFFNSDLVSPLDGMFLESPLFNFSMDESGEVDYLVPQIGFDVWQKSGPLDNPQSYLSVMLFLYLVFLTAAVTIFYPSITEQPNAKWVPSLMLFLLVLMPLTIMVGYSGSDTVVGELFFGRANRFILFALVANIIAICALYFVWQTVLAWRNGYWGSRRTAIAMRLHYTLLGIAAFLFIPIFVYFNLIGF